MPTLNPFPVRDVVLRLELASLDDTAFLGRRLADAVRGGNPGALLLYGQLGAGKTTLCRALVSALPGGKNAETASPSFTISNIYCTEPLVHHYDLYRLPPGAGDESLEESFEDDGVLTIVEWPEHLDPRDVPEDGLCLELSPGPAPEARRAALAPLGPLGADFLDRVRALFSSSLTLLANKE
jgi:tRNA threonylcarbamoyl adenosine modification protein YjeE